MVNNNRAIENTWSMLQYLYPELRGKKFKTMDITHISTMDDLYASVISRWCASLAKEGLYKEYVEIEDEELTAPRGQVNVQESITRQTKLRGSLICSYDELSEDIYINHILKGTLQYLLYEGNLEENIRHEVEKAIQLFNGVRYVDIKNVQWKNIKFNNSNMRYKNLIDVCKNLLFEKDLVKDGELDDNKRMYILFKKQIIKWFKLTYSDDIVEVFEQPYTMPDMEPPFEYKINKVQKLLTIRTERQALVLCIRLQDEVVLDDKTLPRKQINELVKYLREYNKLYKTKASGCLIYVNIDKRKLNLNPITVNVVNDFSVGEIIIDIHDQWRFITNKLNDIYKYFIQREKNKKRSERVNKNESN